MKNVPYRQAVGSLMYAMVAIRPDIANAVRQVAKFMHNPGRLHWNRVKRILRYVKGTIQLGLKYKAVKGVKLFGYVDASYADDVDQRRSTTGWCFVIAGATVSWCSRTQRSTSLSTAEAEYIAAADAAREAIWLRQFLSELGFPQESTIIYEDNQAAIALATDHGVSRRTKHIDVRHHFLRDCVTTGKLVLCYLSSKEMVADILTKAVNTIQFNKLRDVLLLCSKF